MEELTTTRSKDQVSTAAIDQFVSRFFFKKVYGAHEMVTDRDRQLKGIDVIVGNMKIDCKAMSAPQYINHPRPTFVQEIWSYSPKAHTYREGWFVNPGETTHYLFIWVTKANVAKGNYITNSKEIEELEVMLVDSAAFHEFVYSYASRERLVSYGWHMIENKISEPVQLSNFFSWGRLAPSMVRSGQLAEGPVNLVMPKDILRRFAVKHCYVTAKEITDIH